MALHFADCWELIADRIPDQPAIAQGNRTLSWAAYDDAAARLASVFEAHGLGPGRHVGMFLYNCPEYLMTQYATFKHETAAININYRYLDDELVYLIDNADVTALVYHRSLADRVQRVRGRLPNLTLLIEVDDGDAANGASARPSIDGALSFGDALAAAAPQARRQRDPDGLYMLYTGGTTGMPKGVMYTVADLTGGLAAAAAGNLGVPVWESAEALATFVAEQAEVGALSRCCPAPPLMHATGAWLGAFMPHMTGGCSELLASRALDPDEVIAMCQRGLTMLVIVGDAFARPLLKRLDERRDAGDSSGLTGLMVLLSSGAMLSAEVKEGLFEHHPGLIILDALGSSEGTMASKVSVGKGSGTTAKFELIEGTKVFDEHDNEVEAGSGVCGVVATTGDFLPIGYYKDPEKSARTFRTVRGVRYSFPGDMATVTADGTIEFMGRGANCINTGGEKVFPEEVEEAIKTHAAVDDCLVFGVDDDRFGQAVTAVVSVSAPIEPSQLIAYCKTKLASYKAPQSVTVVPIVPRAPNGKADYKAARALADT